MSEDVENELDQNFFYAIQKRAREIVVFHGITHNITFTDDEMDAIELGMSSGIHAAFEEIWKP